MRDDSSSKWYLKGYGFCTIVGPSVVHPGAVAALAATYPLTILGMKGHERSRASIMVMFRGITILVESITHIFRFHDSRF